MEVVAHGIDLVDFPRIEQMVAEHGERFLNRIFTSAEQAYARTNRNGIETILPEEAPHTKLLPIWPAKSIFWNLL